MNGNRGPRKISLVTSENDLGLHLPRGLDDNGILEVADLALSGALQYGTIDRSDVQNREQVSDLPACVRASDRLARQVEDRGDGRGAYEPLNLAPFGP